MKNTYPIIKINYKYVGIRGVLPPINIAAPKEPEKPKLQKIDEPKSPSKPDLSYSDGYVGILVLLFLLGSLFLYLGLNVKSSKGFESVLFGIVLLSIFVFLIYSSSKYNSSVIVDYEKQMEQYHLEKQIFPKKVQENLRNFEHLTNIYNEKYSVFENDIINYNEIVNTLRQPDAIRDYYENFLKEVFKIVKKPIFSDEKIRKGVTEDYFTNELRRYTNFEIIQNTKLQINNSSNFYYPDIVLMDKNTGLLIDIEIDEPYVGSTGEPIHYINCFDERRDNYFLEEGWFVFRFAEEQIIDNTMGCISLIRDFVDLLYMRDETKKIAPLNKLIDNYLQEISFPIKQWTKDDANKMAFRRYRNNYLGYKLSEQLENEL